MVDHVPRRSGPAYRSYPRLVAGTGSLLIVGSSVIYLVDPTQKLWIKIGISVGVVLLLVAILLRPAAVHQVLTGRRVQYASNAFIMCLAFAGILGLINFLSFENSYELDLTETGEYTLSPQTISVLENLTEPVQIVGFFRAEDQRRTRANEILKRYGRHSDLLDYGLHDPISEPALADSYDLNDFGLVFVSGVHRYEAHRVSEQSITTGLMCVTTHRHNRDDQELIKIERPQPTSRQLVLTPFQTGITFLISLLLIPLIALVPAFWVWWLKQ
jgi:ABC-type uncharacterized transport system involved in gliding motility auxiliary subunit